MSNRDSSPVYYREIQKHAYLKRVPDDNGSKLRPLVLKKPPLKPMWTQLCVHNGRTPYLEQYKDAASARAHRPAWRASLVTTRHVTAGVTRDTECDFLVDTQEGPVRMLAPNWDSMQDWVSTLRNKLRELRIVSVCENEYCSPPARAAPRAPRAAARDPASPLPPTPPLPPDRVPGIDLSSVIRVPSIPESNPETPAHAPEAVDISDWDETLPSVPSLPSLPTVPSTSQVPSSVANICGQNICLDGSLLKRDGNGNDDDQESDTTNVTVIAVTTKPDTDLPPPSPSSLSLPPVSLPPVSSSPGHLIHIGSDETYGSVFEPDYEHLSRACSAVRLRVNDATYEYLFPVENGSNNHTTGERNATGERQDTERRLVEERNFTTERQETAERKTVDRQVSGESSIGDGQVIGERVTGDRQTTGERQVAGERSTGDRQATGERQVTVERQIPIERVGRGPLDAARWRRGLTELALLGRRHADSNQETPAEHVTSRSRELRTDARRRSSSLSNGVPPALTSPLICERINANEQILQPLRIRQAAALIRAQRRGAACAARVNPGDAPILADYDNHVWVARWGVNSRGVGGGRAGDRLCAVGGVTPTTAGHAGKLFASKHAPIDILFYRVPLAKIFVIAKRDQQKLGISLDKECGIRRIVPRSPAASLALPPGAWALTEVNETPLNLLKGGEEQMNRISLNGTEASLLIQPTPLVRRLRAALKANR